MKFFGTVVVLQLLCLVSLQAQKFGYVDTKYVLSKMPEYAAAQDEINKLSLAWEEEVAELRKKLDAMETELKAEEVLLTAEMYKERKEEINVKWGEVADYQKKIFGFDGLLFLKKKELIKPVQDKVFEAVEKVAKNNRLQIVFDKAGELVMIYTDPIHDYTDYVLEELGLGDANDTIK